jgi:hypothetical protein
LTVIPTWKYALNEDEHARILGVLVKMRARIEQLTLEGVENIDRAAIIRDIEAGVEFDSLDAMTGGRSSFAESEATSEVESNADNA